MVSDALETFHETLRSTRTRLNRGGLTLGEMRADADRLSDHTAKVSGAVCAPVTANGVSAEWVTVDDAAQVDGAALLYLHGGGFIMGSVAGYRRFAAHLAAAAGADVLVLDYRLAPEDPFPAAVEDVVAGYHWLLAEGRSPGRIALIGDSAGGNLALAALVALRSNGVELPAGAVLLSPFVDLTVSGASVLDNAALDLVNTRGALRAMAATYLCDEDPATPLASPLFADLTGLPPLYLQVGDCETLLDDSRRLAATACHAGVNVTLDVQPEMQHVFQLTAGHAPEADKAISSVASFLRQILAA